MLPTACNMPDLSDLQRAPLLGQHLLQMLIGVDKRFPKAMTAYRKNIVRLSDKAVREYMDIRRLVVAQIAESNRPTEQLVEGRILHAAHIPDYLEDCILTVRRLFRYYERIKSDQSRFPLDRQARRRIEKLEASIKETRNLIEHLDDEISGKDEEVNHWTAPMLDRETRTVQFGSLALEVSALAAAIRHFHDFARDFMRYRRTPEGVYEILPPEGPLDAV